MKTLILGDCASAGTNVLTREITGQANAVIEYSLTWGGKYWKDVIVWYLKQTKNERQPIKDLDMIPFEAVRYLWEQELANSYWKHIDKPVTTLSKNGATAGGYYKRLLKYEKENGRPDLIFVTDHTINHNWQVINYEGKKYFFEKNFNEKSPAFQLNKNLQSPEQVQYLAYLKAREHYEKGTVIKRNKRIMNWFINFLDRNKYRYTKIKFYNGFSDFDDDKHCIDCSDLVSKYNNGNGDQVDVKVEMASKIAGRILKNWPLDK